MPSSEARIRADQLDAAARKYEAAAERGFFRALKELRLLVSQAKELDPAAKVEVFRQESGSILATEKMDDEFDAMDPEMGEEKPELVSRAITRAYSTAPSGRVDVPFTIGRAR